MQKFESQGMKFCAVLKFVSLGTTFFCFITMLSRSYHIAVWGGDMNYIQREAPFQVYIQREPPENILTPPPPPENLSKFFLVFDPPKRGY